MDRLTEMEAFVQVVDHGGFTDAARKMGLSKSAVSKHVSALEARLAVRLLNRTTRRVSPTELGLAYYDRARSVLSEAGEADSMVTAMQATPTGSLRVSAPVSFGVMQLVAGGGAVSRRLPAGRHQHGARRPLRGAGGRGLRPRDPHRHARGQLAQGEEARRGARPHGRGALLPRRGRHAAEHRRPDRAPAAALLQPLDRQLLAAARRFRRGAADPGRRAAHRQQRRVADEGGGGRARHRAGCRRSCSATRWKPGGWSRCCPTAPRACSASTRSIRRAAFRSRSCAPSSTSSPSTSRAAAPTTGRRRARPERSDLRLLQHFVDPALPSRAGRLELLDHVRVEPDRDLLARLLDRAAARASAVVGCSRRDPGYASENGLALARGLVGRSPRRPGPRRSFAGSRPRLRRCPTEGHHTSGGSLRCSIEHALSFFDAAPHGNHRNRLRAEPREDHDDDPSPEPPDGLRAGRASPRPRWPASKNSESRSAKSRPPRGEVGQAFRFIPYDPHGDKCITKIPRIDSQCVANGASRSTGVRLPTRPTADAQDTSLAGRTARTRRPDRRTRSAHAVVVGESLAHPEPGVERARRGVAAVDRQRQRRRALRRAPRPPPSG